MFQMMKKTIQKPLGPCFLPSRNTLFIMPPVRKHTVFFSLHLSSILTLAAKNYPDLYIFDFRVQNSKNDTERLTHILTQLFSAIKSNEQCINRNFISDDVDSIVFEPCFLFPSRPLGGDLDNKKRGDEKRINRKGATTKFNVQNKNYLILSVIHVLL